MSDAVQILVLAISIIFVLVWAAQTALKWVGAKRDAGAAWRDLQAGDAKAAGKLGETDFRRLYMRVHGPRGALYLFAALAAVLVVSPLALALLSGVWRGIWHVSGRPEYFAEGYLLWQFYMFFGLVASWVWVSAVVARRYHQNAPLSLDDELKKVLAKG